MAKHLLAHTQKCFIRGICFQFMKCSKGFNFKRITGSPWVLDNLQAKTKPGQDKGCARKPQDGM